MINNESPQDPINFSNYADIVRSAHFEKAQKLDGLNTVTFEVNGDMKSRNVIAALRFYDAINSDLNMERLARTIATSTAEETIETKSSKRRASLQRIADKLRIKTPSFMSGDQEYFTLLDNIEIVSKSTRPQKTVGQRALDGSTVKTTVDHEGNFTKLIQTGLNKLEPKQTVDFTIYTANSAPTNEEVNDFIETEAKFNELTTLDIPKDTL